MYNSRIRLESDQHKEEVKKIHEDYNREISNCNERMMQQSEEMKRLLETVYELKLEISTKTSQLTQL